MALIVTYKVGGRAHGNLFPIVRWRRVATYLRSTGWVGLSCSFEESAAHVPKHVSFSGTNHGLSLLQQLLALQQDDLVLLVGLVKVFKKVTATEHPWLLVAESELLELGRWLLADGF